MVVATMAGVAAGMVDVDTVEDAGMVVAEAGVAEAGVATADETDRKFTPSHPLIIMHLLQQLTHDSFF